MSQHEPKKYPRTIESRNTYLRIRAPEHLDVALEGLIRKVLKEQPNMDNIYSFAADYFDTLLKIREKAGIKKISIQDICPFHNDDDASEMIKLASVFAKYSKEGKKSPRTYRPISLRCSEYNKNLSNSGISKDKCVKSHTAKYKNKVELSDTILTNREQTNKKEAAGTEENQESNQSEKDASDKDNQYQSDMNILNQISTGVHDSKSESDLTISGVNETNDIKADISDVFGNIDEIKSKIREVECEITILEVKDGVTMGKETNNKCPIESAKVSNELEIENKQPESEASELNETKEARSESKQEEVKEKEPLLVAEEDSATEENNKDFIEMEKEFQSNGNLEKAADITASSEQPSSIFSENVEATERAEEVQNTSEEPKKEVSDEYEEHSAILEGVQDISKFEVGQDGVMTENSTVNANYRKEVEETTIESNNDNSKVKENLFNTELDKNFYDGKLPLHDDDLYSESDNLPVNLNENENELKLDTPEKLTVILPQEDTILKVQKFLHSERQYSAPEKENIENLVKATENTIEQTRNGHEVSMSGDETIGKVSLAPLSFDISQGENDTVGETQKDADAKIEERYSGNKSSEVPYHDEGRESECADNDKDSSTTSDEMEFDTTPVKIMSKEGSVVGIENSNDKGMNASDSLVVEETKEWNGGITSEKDLRNVVDVVIEEFHDSNTERDEKIKPTEITGSAETKDDKQEESKVMEGCGNFLEVPTVIMEENPVKKECQLLERVTNANGENGEEKDKNEHVSAVTVTKMDYSSAEDNMAAVDMVNAQEKKTEGENSEPTVSIMECENIGNTLDQSRIRHVEDELLQGVEDEILHVEIVTKVDNEISHSNCKSNDHPIGSVTSTIESQFEISVQTKVFPSNEAESAVSDGKNETLFRAAVVIQNAFRRFKTKSDSLKGVKTKLSDSKTSADGSATKEDAYPAVETRRDEYVSNYCEADSPRSSTKRRNLQRSTTSALFETRSMEPVEMITPLKSRSLSTVRGGAADFEVWNQLVLELEEAATKIQSNYRGYKTRKRLKRENAVQSTMTSQETASLNEQSGGNERSTGEFHDSIVLSVHPK